MVKMYFYKEDLKHSSTGKERKNHKYIARVPIKRIFGKQKYRYFYTLAEWRAYNNNVNKTKNVIKTGSNIIKSIQKGVSDIGKKITSKKSYEEKGKAFVNKYKNQPVNSLTLILPTSTIRKAFSFVKSTISKIGSGISILFGKDNSEKKEHKYYEKVKLPNGKTRYFYSKDEYESYIKRINYQKNEPSFMKKIKDIADDVVFNKHEDMEKVNEDYNPYDDDTSMNCSNCSVAYELRRRGYDVEAKPADDNYNGTGYRVYDYFENAKLIGINGDGSTVSCTEKFTKKLWDKGDVSKIDYSTNRDEAEFWTTKQKYTAKSLEKAILDNNPPGSRGFIDVNWKSGGAHSIVYEVTTDKKVIIRDSQVYDEYDLNELAGNVNHVRIARTDNLQVKENILNAVKENKDGDRLYYVDKERVNKYRKGNDPFED